MKSTEIRSQAIKLAGVSAYFTNPNFSSESVDRVTSEIDNTFSKKLPDKAELLLGAYYIYRGNMAGSLAKLIHTTVEERIGESMYERAKELAALFQENVYEYAKMVRDYYWGCDGQLKKKLDRIPKFITTCVPHMKDYFKGTVIE